MTPQEFAKIQRSFLLSNEREAAARLAAEFETLKTEISAYLLQNMPKGTPSIPKLHERNLFQRILGRISKEIEVKSASLASIVEKSQRNVIRRTAQTLAQYLKIEASIFDIDKPAIKKLIGGVQSGSTLTKFFARLDAPLREEAKSALIMGFGLGESSADIAKRLQDAADVAKPHALSIARTETNEAYRAASRDFYQAADIKKYIWISVLSSNTCLICWGLHGQRFKTSVKVFSHPQCRCVMIPDKGQKIKTGMEIFKNLPAGYQQQILGKGGFEKYRDGFALSDFAGIKNTSDGLSYYRRPLNEITKELYLHPARSFTQSEKLLKTIGFKEIEIAGDFAGRAEKVADYVSAGLKQLAERFPKAGMPDKIRFVLDAPDPNYQAWFNSRDNSLNVNLKHFIWNDIDYWMEEFRGVRHHSTGERFHLITHEYAHYFHYLDNSIALKKIKLTPDEIRLIQEEVSNYAAFDSSEFVAEVFTGLFFGKSYSNKLLKLYNKYGGIKPV